MVSLDMLSGHPVLASTSTFEDDLALAKQLSAHGKLDEALRIWTNLRLRFPDRRQQYIEAATQLRHKGRMEEAEVWLSLGQQHFPNDLGFAIERGWLAFHRRDLPEAIRRWEDLRAKFPDQASGYVGLAVCLRDDGRSDEAEKLLADAKRKFPTDVGIFVEYAWLPNQRRDWPEAISRWEDVRRNFPDCAVGYTAGAASLREAGRIAEAEALLCEAVARFPDDAGMATEFAQLAHHQRNWPEAQARWQRVRDLFPESRDGYLIGARSLQAAGEPQKAIMLLAEAMCRWPGNRELLNTSAHLAFERGATDEAIRLGREMMRLFPADPTGTFHTVRALRDSGQAREAEDLLGNAPETYPGDPAILSIWASLAMTRSDWPEAIRRWGMLRERFPEDPKFWWQYANALWRMSRDREADILLDEAGARFPVDPMIQSMWIDAAMRCRNWQAAAERAAAVRERLPNLAAGYTLGARVLRQSGRDDLAEALLREARQHLPHDPHVRRAEAEDAMARRDWQAAEQLWTEVRTAQPDDISGYVGGATCLREAGHHALADTMMRAALERFPSSVAVHSMFATLAHHRQDYIEAIQRWETLRRRFPESESGYVGGARALHEAGRVADADALMREAVQQFPGDPDVAIQYARFAVAQANHTAAEARFRSAAERFPLRSDAVIGLVEALFENGRHDEAETVLADVVERFRDDSAIFSAYATAAMLRLDWNEALRRWTEMTQRFPNESSVPQKIFEARLRLAETGPEPLPTERAPDVATDEGNMIDLVQQFESLGGAGHGCEFGLFQRNFGAEPLGLLRWADLGHELLTRALETDFEGVGDPEHTELFTPPSDRPEYWTRDRRYWMAMRCFIFADQVPYEKMFTQACRRIQYLRRKLIEDLRSGEKIFVFKCLRRTLAEPELAQLHAAVRRYGRNTLLYVGYEDAENPNGTVRVRANGLMVGYVDRFSFSPDEENLGPATDSWAGVCRVAYDLWLGGKTERSVDVDLEPPPAVPAEVPLGDGIIAQLPDPAAPVVTVKWSDEHLTCLREEMARRAPDTREYMFANLQLDVANGDLAAARQRIGDVLNRFAFLYPHDGYTFEALVVAAVLSSQWDLVRRFVNDRFGHEWCSAVTAERLQGGGQTIRWEIAGDGTSQFCFDSTMIGRDRVWIELVQFVRTLTLFHDYSTYAHAERGSVRVNLGDSGVIPGLAFCEFQPEYFLVPDPVFLNTDGYEALRKEVDDQLVPWAQRVPVAFWRGSTTGQRRGDWRSLQRIQLCLIAKAAEGLIDAGVTNIVGMPPDMVAEVEAADVRRPFVRPVDFMKFKYQIDVDGNTNAWAALFQKLYTGSPVLKVASPFGYRQWFYDELRPWWNYVPVAADMSDLVEKIKWLQAHDDQARLIGERGRMLVVSMTHSVELARTRRTVTAAIRHFAGHSDILIRFGRDDADIASLLDGWSEIERGGRWAMGPEARLRVLRPMTEGELTLRLTVAPGSDGGAGQRMIIVADGQAVHECRVLEAGVVECRIPPDRPFARDSVAITLMLPDTMTNDAALCGSRASSLHFKELLLGPVRDPTT